MIDVHSHILPGIDDGSRSVEQSVAVLEALARHGVTDIVGTPHAKASALNRGGDEILAARQNAYQSLMPEIPAGINVHLGLEIMLDEPLTEAALHDRRFSLAGSKYYLVEFLPSVAVDIATRVLSGITNHAIPLVAHPERYSALSVRTAGSWRDIGARLQVDATTLTLRSNRGKKARELLSVGLADLVAADNHGTRQSMRTAARYLTEKGCTHVIDFLTRANPYAVLSDGEMQRVPGVKIGGGFIDGMMSFLKG